MPRRPSSRLALFLAAAPGLLVSGCAGTGSAPDSGQAPAAGERLYDGKPLSYWLVEVRDLAPAHGAVAAEALARFGEAAAPAVPDLTRLLCEEDTSPCQSAVRALIAIGPAAMPGMEVALACPDAWSRNKAADALCRLIESGHRTSTLVDTLVGNLKKRHDWYLVRALGLLGPEASAAIPELETMLPRSAGAAATAPPVETAGRSDRDVVKWALERIRGGR